MMKRSEVWGEKKETVARNGQGLEIRYKRVT